MPPRSKPADKPAEDVVAGAPTDADLGTDKGYIGSTPDPRPNEDYTLATGPDSPTAQEGMRAARTAAEEADGA